MSLIGKIISAPGKIVGAAAEVTASLPAIPADVANKAMKGVEKGMDRTGRALDGKDVDDS